MYAGALDDPNSQYAAKVLAEKARLEPLRVQSAQNRAIRLAASSRSSMLRV